MGNSLKRESLTEQIKSILIERIADGSLGPGDRLKELQVAREFGTSQAPAREAIRSLQALGYIEHKPHVGAVVKTFSRKEIEEAYQIREALEGHCLILADIDIDTLAAKLEQYLDEMYSALQKNDVRSFSRADNLFHRAIVAHSENLQMLSLWDGLRIQLQVVATIVEASMPLEKLYQLHSPIVRALQKNQRVGSARLLTRHYKEIGAYWKKHG